MLWLLALALLVAWYAGPTAYGTVAVLTILFMLATIGFSLLGVRETREHG